MVTPALGESTAALRDELGPLAVRGGGLSAELLTPGDRRIQVSALRVRDRRGETVGQYLLLCDRTEERRLERVARQTQRMQTVGTLAAGIAHEVNNPLAFIRANLTEIQRLGEIAESHRQGPDAKLADELADLPDIAAETLDGIHRIERIVSGMRRLSTPRGEPVSRVDLNEVARDAVRLANLHRDTRVTVVLDLWQEPVWVEGSARRLVQAVLNVVLNAHQALERGCDGRIAISTRADGDQALLEVTDNGPGIAPELQERIFDPFFTTKSPDKGTGLGLAIAFDIARDHGGLLDVRSGPGEGATFALRLQVCRVRRGQSCGYGAGVARASAFARLRLAARFACAVIRSLRALLASGTLRALQENRKVRVAPEFVFTMRDVRKVVPPDRVILDEITLYFLPGAKIGVLGANGAGKSSLLRIMAGLDSEHLGEARPAEGIRVGFLQQEPQLDPSKNVLGNVEEGVAETRALLHRFEELSAKFAEPLEDEEMTALLEEQAKLQDRIDAAGAWELDRTLELAMDALRLPPGDAEVKTLSGGERRRVALCRLLLQKPDLLLLDEPTNHLDAESVAWLERYLQEYPGTVVAVTHDRYFLDNAAGWILELDRGRGIPWQGNYSSWLDQKSQRLAVEEKQASARRRTLERELEWVRMAPRARQAKSKARIQAYEALAAQQESRVSEGVEIVIPPGPQTRRRRGRGRAPAQGLRRSPADRRPQLLAPAGRHRRRDRRERRRQDHPVPHDHRRGEAGRRRAAARQDREDRLRRPVPGCPRPEEERLAGDLGR